MGYYDLLLCSVRKGSRNTIEQKIFYFYLSERKVTR